MKKENQRITGNVRVLVLTGAVSALLNSCGPWTAADQALVDGAVNNLNATSNRTSAIRAENRASFNTLLQNNKTEIEKQNLRTQHVLNQAAGRASILSDTAGGSTTLFH